jgi:hypothetical protein
MAITRALPASGLPFPLEDTNAATTAVVTQIAALPILRRRREGDVIEILLCTRRDRLQYRAAIAA